MVKWEPRWGHRDYFHLGCKARSELRYSRCSANAVIFSEREAVVEELFSTSADLFFPTLYKFTISESLIPGPKGMLWLL